MSRSLLATVLAAWGLIGTPALCVAGVIRHACESGAVESHAAAADCPCDADPCHPESAGSEHQGDCDQDPCTGLVVRPESPEELPGAGSPAIVAVETARFASSLQSLRHEANRAGPERFASSGHVHPSDLPLLL